MLCSLQMPGAAACWGCMHGRLPGQGWRVRGPIHAILGLGSHAIWHAQILGVYGYEWLLPPPLLSSFSRTQESLRGEGRERKN